MLKDLLILDFSARLPGPLGTKILQDLGAKIIKIEPKQYPDAFSQMSEGTFIHWYDAFQAGKEITTIDFENEKDLKTLQALVDKCDAVLWGLHPKLKATFKLPSKNIAWLDITASTTKPRPMHDLNAMADTQILSLYAQEFDQPILPPPFLPFAGISFAQSIATHLLGMIHQSHKEQKTITKTIGLMEEATRLYDLMWPKEDRRQKKFLHNGAYPSYCLYQTKDKHYLAVAAVEEKFWAQFITLFHIPLALDDRFSTNEESFWQVAKIIGQLSVSEIETRLKNLEICLSIVRR